MNTYIKSLGHYLPTKTILNSDLEKLVDTSDQWITERTGIKQRHVAAADQMTSDLALEAAKQALANAQVTAEELDAIIFATATPDAVLPQAACILQRKLGASRAFCFDLGAACSGFIYSLSVADALIRTQKLENVLIVGAETLSRITDYRDRETCILFGDGAGAALLGRTEKSTTPLSTFLASDGNLGDLLTLKNDRPTDPFWREASQTIPYVEMRGKEVFKNAVRTLTQGSQIVLERAGLHVSEIDWFIPHQANNRIMSAVAEQLQINESRIVSNIHITGNTSSASIPVAMSQYVKNGKIKRGDKVLMSAFGAGLTSGAAVFQF